MISPQPVGTNENSLSSEVMSYALNVLAGVGFIVMISYSVDTYVYGEPYTLIDLVGDVMGGLVLSLFLVVATPVYSTFRRTARAMWLNFWGLMAAIAVAASCARSCSCEVSLALSSSPGVGNVGTDPSTPRSPFPSSSTRTPSGTGSAEADTFRSFPATTCHSGSAASRPCPLPLRPLNWYW